MKNLKTIIFALGLACITSSCMKEEIEIEICSCITIVTDADGNSISKVNSAEEAPISGNCLDHNFTVTDPETGNTTSKLCR